jgi:hypothetical protein
MVDKFLAVHRQDSCRHVKFQFIDKTYLACTFFLYAVRQAEPFNEKLKKQ